MTTERYYIEPDGCIGDDDNEGTDVYKVMDRQRWNEKGAPYCVWGGVPDYEAIRMVTEMNAEVA